MEEMGAYPVIIFGSALHGSGRSFLADLTYKKFVAAGIPAERLSTGKIFREIAEEHGLTIEEFMKLQTTEPEKFYAMNISVDAKVHKLMEEKSMEKTIVIDSNLAAYHAEIPNAYALLVYAKPEVVGKRVYSAKREAERPFSSPDDALEQMIERTNEDIRLYRQLSALARDNFWKMVYRIAAKDMEQNLERILRGEIPESPFFHRTIDNNETPEKSWEQIEEWIGSQR